MTSRPNWRKVADRLAVQLSVHAFCGQHSLSEARSDCPFCADRAAYRAYLAAGGYDHRPAAPTGKLVPLSDLPPGEHLGTAELVTADDGTQSVRFRKNKEGQ